MVPKKCIIYPLPEYRKNLREYYSCLSINRNYLSNWRSAKCDAPQSPGAFSRLAKRVADFAFYTVVRPQKSSRRPGSNTRLMKQL